MSYALPVTYHVKRYTFLTLILISAAASAQSGMGSQQLIAGLHFSSSLPPKLLAGRTVVLYDQSYTAAELQQTQTYFQQSGIDAVLYVDADYVVAGTDPSRVFANYFNTRNIKFVILLRKAGKGFQIAITEYNGTPTFVDGTKASWTLDDSSLASLLQALYRFSIATQRKESFLINDLPETEFQVKYFREREEKVPQDLRQGKVALPRSGSAARQAQLEEFFKLNFPFKYEWVDSTLTDRELDDKGFRLVLKFVHTRGDIARDILGYDISQTAGSLVSTTYEEGQPKVKTISAKSPIFKYYLRNTEYGNIFLGTRWDADQDQLTALSNFVFSLRQDLRR